MKLQLDSAWYEREIGNDANLPVTAGRSTLAPLREEARLHRVSLASRNATPVAFGRLVNLKRREEGMGLEELADRAGIDLGMLIAIERGEEFPLEPGTVSKIGNVLQLPLPKLLQLSGLTEAEDREFKEAALRFAARSEPIEKLSRAEDTALKEFVKFLSEA